MAKQPEYMLLWLRRRLRQARGLLSPLLKPLYVLLYLAALVWVLWQVYATPLADRFETARNLALLLVTILGAPLVVWRSWVAHRQAEIADEGLVTDRINAAIRSLGAEKTVSRIGRPVTARGEDGAERTLIEWQGGAPAALRDGETLAPGEWQAFSETEPNLEVRVGAILALERIAQRTDDAHVQIMQILCAYIRQNAPAESAADPPAPELPAETATAADWQIWRDAYHEALSAFCDGLRPRIDIQTALTVLGRRSARQRDLEASWPGDSAAAHPFDEPFPDPPANEDWSAYRRGCGKLQTAYSDYSGYRLDLRRANLQGCDLSEGDWRGALLSGARMEGADFRWARMQGAVLVSARLQGADLHEAHLGGADLELARLHGASLVGARLQGAVLLRARMQGADLHYAQAQGAHLRKADMSHARLSPAGMSGADLSQALLQSADLMRAKLQGADLWRAQLQGADLNAAMLQGANLREAEFDDRTCFTDAVVHHAAVKSVSLERAGLTQDQVNSMFGDGSVDLPPGIDRPAHWPEDDLDLEEFEKRWREWQRKKIFRSAPG